MPAFREFSSNRRFRGQEQAGIRVEAHEALVAFRLPRQQNQIGQNIVAKNSTPSGSSVGPANPAFSSGRWWRLDLCFQLVDAVKELPTLAWRQCLHLLQYFICTHRPQHTTDWTPGASSPLGFWAGSKRVAVKLDFHGSARFHSALACETKKRYGFLVTATLSKSQAELPRLVEIASRGEDVVITVGGRPKARLTRANVAPGNAPSPKSAVELTFRLKELAALRDKYRSGKDGRTVDQILEETRADRP
jgi:antitoxin (DNA-binding transcriptional repressor) of toxin-antitoxin stability system